MGSQLLEFAWEDLLVKQRMVEEMGKMDNVIMGIRECGQDDIYYSRCICLYQSNTYSTGTFLPNYSSMLNACASQSTCLSWFTVKYANIR